MTLRSLVRPFAIVNFFGSVMVSCAASYDSELPGGSMAGAAIEKRAEAGGCPVGEKRTVGDGCNVCTCVGANDWSCTNRTCATCPAPRPERTSGVDCDPGTVWAKDPTTGTCCSYASTCEAPPGWPISKTEEACLAICGCSGRVDSHIEQPLDCWCASHDCSGTLSDAERKTQQQCSSLGATILRQEGCGMVEFVWSGGFCGGHEIYDRRSGSLIGLSNGSDAPFGACFVYSYEYGAVDLQPEDCADLRTCEICHGVVSTTYPPCPAPP